MILFKCCHNWLKVSCSVLRQVHVVVTFMSNNSVSEKIRCCLSVSSMKCCHLSRWHLQGLFLLRNLQTTFCAQLQKLLTLWLYKIFHEVKKSVISCMHGFLGIRKTTSKLLFHDVRGDILNFFSQPICCQQRFRKSSKPQDSGFDCNPNLHELTVDCNWLEVYISSTG